MVALINAGVALATIGFAVLALAKPVVLSRSSKPEPGEVFYSRMYASRAIPLGMLAGLLPFFSAGLAVVLVLGAAAAAQLGDAIIGLSRRSVGMTAGAAIAAVVHVVAATSFAMHTL